MTINKVCVGGRWGKGTKVARTGNGAVFPTSRVRGGGGSGRWGEKRMCGYRILLRRLLSSFSQTTRWRLFLSFLKSGFEEASLVLEHSVSV